MLVLRPVLAVLTAHSAAGKGIFSSPKSLSPAEDPQVPLPGVSSSRLVFSSKEELTQTVEEVEKLSAAEAAAYMKGLYDQGFKPLVPVVDELEGNALVESYEIRRLEEAGLASQVRLSPGFSLDEESRENAVLDSLLDDDFDIDDGDPIVEDDTFASLLNENREVVVDGLVYKYTVHGIFEVEPSKIQELEEIITEMDGHTPPMETLFQTNRPYDDAESSSPTLEHKMIRDGITQFTAPAGSKAEVKKFGNLRRRLPCGYENELLHFAEAPGSNPHHDGSVPFIVEEPCGGGWGGGGSTGGGSTGGGSTGGGSTGGGGCAANDFDCKANEYLESQGYCDSRPPWISFGGGTRICTEKFSSKRRVKTKFLNQDYIVYRRIGVQVKYQKKSWGIWWTRSTDEIRIGVKQASFKVSYDVPDINAILGSLAVSMVYQNSVYSQSGSYMGSSASLPPLPFGLDNMDSIVINIDLPSFLPTIDINFTAEDFNELFWETLWDQARSLGQSLNPQNPPNDFLVVGVTNDHTYINVVGDWRNYGKKKLTKTWHEDWGFTISIGWTDGGGWGTPNLQPVDLADYSDIEVDFYGIARRGSTWKGSKMLVSQ